MRNVRIGCLRPHSGKAESKRWAQPLLGSFLPNRFRPIEAVENGLLNKGKYKSQS
jgi:hypothetical protein